MQIDIKEDGIGHLLLDNFLKVPIYQRSYTWEKSHVEDLFSDIKASYDDEYFIGTLVVCRKGDYLELIDGQQRLATISLFFAAVRNLFRNNSDVEGETLIEEKYLFTKELRSREKKLKLILNSSDNDFYFKKVIEGQNIGPTRESHERILEAYKIAEKFVMNEFEANNKNKEHIYNLIDFLKDKVKIIVVSVSDPSNAYTIFETLNDRGLTLSQTDLIKNYLFNKSDDRVDEAQVKWSRFTGAVEAAENEDEILQYIRYNWSSKQGFTREKYLFRSIKNKIKDKNNSITLLTNLDEDSQKYLAILNPYHTLWKEYSTNCSDYISALKELRLTQNRPLLLAVLKRFELPEVEKALKIIVSWSVRNLITDAIGAGTLEQEFSNQAKLINEGKIQNSKQLKESIMRVVPTDEQFKKSFEIATVSKSYIARYYLSEIEKSYRPTNELGPLQNPEKINLEHILPQTPDVHKWPQFDKDTHATYYKRIGNMTLMDKKMNSDQKNGPFSEKKKVYVNSEIIITKNLSKMEEWLHKSIEDRQKEFASKAVNIWGLI